MTLAEQKAARVAFVTLLLLAVFGFIYFKWIKPALHKKREDQRVADTDVVVKAQEGTLNQEGKLKSPGEVPPQFNGTEQITSNGSVTTSGGGSATSSNNLLTGIGGGSSTTNTPTNNVISLPPPIVTMPTNETTTNQTSTSNTSTSTSNPGSLSLGGGSTGTSGTTSTSTTSSNEG